MPRKITVRGAAVGGAVLAATALPGGASGGERELPLGPRSIDEHRVSRLIAPGLRLTRIRRGRAGTGRAWRINVLTINPSILGGRVTAGRSGGRLFRLSRTSSMAGRLGALAGVNGGYYAPGQGPTRGDPIGALAIGGRLLSEPLADRVALLIPRVRGRRMRIARLRFAGALAAGGERRLIDGVNRVRGRIPACGGRGGDRPTQRPNPALICTDPSELIVFSRAHGSRTRTRGGHEVVVERGVVTAVRAGGDAPIPRDGIVLSGSGRAGRFLRRTCPLGSRPRVSLTMLSGRRRVRAADYAAILSAGPRLLRRGRVRIEARREGYRGATFQSFVLGRSPRTVVGLRRDGRVLLATVDGRQRRSVGVTLPEAARMLRALGATEAMNLDSGGSTTMVVGRRVVNRPSDPNGERRVGNGLFVVPR
jgi:phosphodiester glycosidase